MEFLNTQTVTTTFSTTQPTGNFNSPGSFQVQIPQSNVMIAKSLSYEFRVAEHIDKDGNIVKVGLQVAIFEHDNCGVRQLRKSWHDIERVKVPV
jgi:hypothetical protein